MDPERAAAIRTTSVLAVILVCGPAILAASPAEEAPPGLGPGDPLTLERIHSDPRLEGVPPREITWSPTGAVVAYLWSEHGVRLRNLWIHDAARGESLRLTDASGLPDAAEQDDALAERRETMRLEESGVDAFVWTPDGRSLVYSLHGDLWMIAAAGGAPRRLTSTDSPEIDPRISPDGSRLAFARDSDLHVMDLETGETIAATRGGSEILLNGVSDYISLEELSRPSAYVWSADSRSLVYIQADTSPVRQLEIPDYLTPHVTHRLQRRPPAGEANAVTRLGVAPASGGESRWVRLQEGITDFYIPLLARAGDRVVVVQEERSLDVCRLFFVDPAEAKARFVLEERDDAWVNLDRLFIGAGESGGPLVWGSERSGWAHLHTLDPATGALASLTSGAWEVTGLDRIAGGQAWFTATLDGPAERHLYRVSLAGGGGPERVTTMAGWNQGQVSPDGKWAAFLHSDVTEPPDLWVAPTEGGAAPRRITQSPAPDFAAGALPVPEIITLKSREDGASIAAALYRPTAIGPAVGPGPKRRRYPAIVHVHGAGYRQEVRRGWGGWRTFIHALFVRQGYYVLDVDYRGSDGYGRAWRTDVHMRLGGPDLEDTLTAAEYLRSLPDVDPARVGIWGWSYGGFLAAMAMMAKPGVLNAGVAIAPVTDWAAYDTHYTEERLGLPEENPGAYEKASPLTYAGRLRDPLLVIHGMSDDNVHAQDTIRLVDALVMAGKDFDLMLYPEAKHGIRRDESRIHLWRKVFRFFRERMP